MTLQCIHKVTICNWRSWKDETVLDDIKKGFIIFNGPNAIGKSGVWEAIVDGLLDKHRGSHTDRLRPVGSSGLIPMVEIEFSANEKFYRIRKRFSRQRASSEATLYEQSRGSWKLIEEGDEAFILCRQIVAGTEAGDISRGGFNNAVKDNLMQVLLPTQGSLIELTKAPPSVASLGVDKAIAKSATQLGRVLTKVTSDITMWNKARTVLIKSDLKEHRDRLDQIEEEIKQLEANSARIESYVNTIRTVSEDLDEMGDASLRVQEAKELHMQAEEHRQQREDAKAVVDATKAEENTAAELLEIRTSLITDLRNKEDSLWKAESDHKAKEGKLKASRKALKLLIKERDTRKSEIKSLRSWLDFETRGARVAELTLSFKAVESRLGTVDKVQTELDKLKETRAKLSLPDEKGWLEWDKLDERLKEAKGKMEAESWLISGSLPEDFVLRVDEEEVDTDEVSGLASTKIEITSPDDTHCFVAVAPEAESESYEEILESVTKFLQRFNVENIDELRARYSQATALNTKISGAESQIATALDASTRDELVQEIGRLNGELEKLNALKTPSVDKPDGEPEEWRIRYKIADDGLTTIQSKIDDATENAGSLDADYKAAKVRLKEVKEELKKIKMDLVTHRNEFGKDEKIKDIHEKKVAAATEATTTWEALEKARGMAEDQKLKTAQKLSDKLTEVITKQNAISGIEGKLTELRRDDPEGQLVVLWTEQSRLKQMVASEQIRADALLLLEQALKSELQKHTEAVGGPIQEKIQTWLQYVLQDDSELLVSDGGLPSVIRNPASQDIGFIEQSFGTKEQISVLYRLAIASLVAEQSGSGVCLMFDDPFGYTDRGRRRRMLEIIEEEVDRCGHQVLLFTCRPEDFIGHGNHYAIMGAEGLL